MMKDINILMKRLVTNPSQSAELMPTLQARQTLFGKADKILVTSRRAFRNTSIYQAYE